MIVYAHERDLFFANRDGSQPHKLIALPDQANEPVWSPDGKAIRFRVGSAGSPSRPGALWEISADGTNLHALLPPGWRNPPQECCGKWSADGRYFIFQSHGNIWARAEKASWFGKANGQPVQLTSGPMSFSTPVPSKDGKKLFVVGALARGELTRYDMKHAQFLPFLSGISAESVSFSKDGEWVAYSSYPDATLWRSKLDGSERIQLSYSPLRAGSNAKLYIVSADGGSPRELIPEDTSPQFDDSWSPDGTRIVFGGVPSDPNSSIRIVDVRTKQISKLPDSKGLFAPCWSPDGRYIAAMPFASGGLRIFDFASQSGTRSPRSVWHFPIGRRTAITSTSCMKRISPPSCEYAFTTTKWGAWQILRASVKLASMVVG